jgi:hypothetical protein
VADAVIEALEISSAATIRAEWLRSAQPLFPLKELHLHVRVHVLQDMNTKTVPPPLTVKEQLINWGFGHTAAGQDHDRGVVGLPQAEVRSINLNTACSFCGSK